MSDRKAAIRLGTEGKAQVIRDIGEIADSGDASAKRWARAYQRAGEDVEEAMQRQARTAAKLATFMPASPVQQRVDGIAGPDAVTGKSARDSALAFKELMAAQEGLEARAKALMLAIDPIAAAQDRFNREIANAQELVSAGVLSLDTYVQKLDHERAALDKVTDALRRKSAEEQGVTYGGINATRVDVLAGGRDGAAKSAADSASIFADSYARMEDRARSLVSSIDPVFAAQTRVNATMREAKTLLDAGALSTERYQQIEKSLAGALDGTAARQEIAAKSAARTSMAFQQLNYQAGDVVAQLATGTNPAVVFAQQASQIVYALSLLGGGSGEGGEGGAAAGAGSAIGDMTDTLSGANDTFDAATGAAERLTTVLGGSTASTEANAAASGTNAAAHEGQAAATGAASAATGANTTTTTVNTGATEANAAATTAAAAAKARFVTFLTGPWGAAVLGGVTLLGLLATSYLNNSEAAADSAEALEEMTDKLKEDAASSERAARAKDVFSESLNGLVVALRAEDAALKDVQIGEESAAQRAAIEARNRMQLVLSIRQTTQARLADLIATRESIKASPLTSAYLGGQGNFDPGAGGIEELKKQLADAERATAAAEKLLNLRLVDVANENAQALSDPVRQLNRQFDEQARAARNAAREAARNGQAVTTALERQLVAIERNRAAAVKAEQDKQRELTRTTDLRRDGDAATSASVAKMLRAEIEGVRVTSTTGGKHVKNSYHYRNQAIDFVPPGGMGSMTKDDVRRIFNARGIEIIELLGPGDKGHSDHFHVAWAKGKASLDEFTDAAKRAEERADALADLTRQYAPLTAAADEYRKTLAEIDRLKPPNAAALRAGARAEYLGARGTLLGDRIGLSGLEAGGREEQAAIDKRAEEDKRRADFVTGMLADQGDALGIARAELSLVAANDNVRQGTIAKLKLIADLKRAGVSIDGAEGIQILANADALDEVLAQMQRQRAIWEEIRGFGSDFVDTVLSPDTWSDWGEGGKRVLDMLKSEFVKLALLNPIRNLLFGESNATLSSVFGALGKVFGAGAGVSTPAAGGSQGFIGPPGAASGTPYTSGGDMLVGEFGPEIARMPRGASIVPAGETRRMLAANDRGPAQVSQYFDLRGALVQEKVYQDMAAMGAQAATAGAAGGAAMGQAEASAAGARRLGRQW